MVKKASMQHIADFLNISKNSVSLALNGKKGVSPELRVKILDAAKQLNYSGYAQYEDNKKNKVLIVIPEYLMSPEVLKHFYNELLIHIEISLRNYGYMTITTYLYRESEERGALPDLLNDIQFAAVAFVGVIDKAYIAQFRRSDVPFVLIDNYYFDLPCSTVISANMEGAYTAVRHLISQGHKQIGFIGPTNMTIGNYERWIGYTRALEEAGIPVTSSYNLTHSARHSTSEEELDAFLADLPGYPTAWFCANDNMAISLINSLRKQNKSIPEDISVIGFDDTDAASLITPKLTTVRVNRKTFGEKAAQLIIDKIADPEMAFRVNVYSELVIRDSVRSLQ